MAKKKTQDLATAGISAVANVQEHLKTLEVEYVPIGSIHPNAYNPNVQSDAEMELLKKSIVANGFTQPIVVNRTSRTIVDGEHRWRVARWINANPERVAELQKQAGVEPRPVVLNEIPVCFTDMTEVQMRLSTFRHNRARGSEDMDQSIAVLRDLETLGALDSAQGMLGLSDEQVNRLLSTEPVAGQLASEEFGEAWVPTKADPSSKEAEYDTGDHPMHISRTDEALADELDASRRMAHAQTDEERAAINRETQRKSFRVTVMYAGDEAALVKAVLGDRAAQKLVSLCRQKEIRDAV